MMLTVSVIAGLICLSEICLSGASAVIHSGTGYLFSAEIMADFYPGIRITFLFDSTALTFLSSVCCIASAVTAFSASYMRPEPFYGRFHAIVAVFVGAMLLLILSPDFLTMMIGWDGLGVSSFLLVVYFQNQNAWNAGMLTLLSNRLGDVLLMLAMALLVSTGNWDLTATSSPLSAPQGVLPAVLLAAGACTKSAQIPFSAWLPAAMAAPTPVSALVHSSTLVTAGVYLLVRLSPGLFEFTLPQKTILILGSLTMFMAGASAMFEYDMKKMVALSTLSQLGLMMSSLGAGLETLAFFHLLTHAFFKSLLFMATGSLIHAVGGSQDLRVTFIASGTLPVTTSLVFLSSSSLMGLPFMSGFYSKDAFLETACSGTLELAAVALFFTGCVFTFLYSIRFLWLVFLLESRAAACTWAGEADLSLSSPACAQALLSVVAGAALSSLWVLDVSYLYLTFYIKNLILFLLFVSASAASAVIYKATYFAMTLDAGLGSLWGLNWSAKSWGSGCLSASAARGVLATENLYAPTLMYLSILRAARVNLFLRSSGASSLALVLGGTAGWLGVLLMV